MPTALMVAANHALFHESDTPKGAALARRATELDPSHSLAHSQACIASMFAGDVDAVVAHGQHSADTAADDMERLLGLMVLGNALFFNGAVADATAGG